MPVARSHRLWISAIDCRTTLAMNALWRFLGQLIRVHTIFSLSAT